VESNSNNFEDIVMKLGDLNERELQLFLIAEVRDVRKTQKRIEKKLDNHLHHCWQIVVALVGILGVAATSLLLALL
jgi:hypothetical protein